MDTLDQLRSLRVLLADTDPLAATRLHGELRACGFAQPEIVLSADALVARLQQALRYREADLGLVLIPATFWREADADRAAHVTALAAEANTLMVLINPAEPDERLLERARNAGFTDVLPAKLTPSQMLARLALTLSLRRERGLRREREEHLEGELSERRVMEARLHFIAYHDELTGLYNRRRLKQALEIELLHTRSFGRPCSLLLLDIDRFKLVNDLEGAEVGDRLLIEVSRLLAQATEAEDVIARIGSDEFVLLLIDCDEAAALARAEQIRQSLEAYRFAYGRRHYRTCASIGLTTVQPRDEGLDPGEVLARADQACYLAKQNGRNRLHVYRDDDPQLARLRSDFSWAPRIREALEQNRLLFHYQPVVRLSDGRITHYELLIRLQDALGVIHGPAEFIPVAERTGLIHEIDLWVVSQAVDFLARLPADQSGTGINVNLSGHAFNNPRLFPLLAQKLEMKWVSPTRLVFEITETAAVDNFEQSREMVARLRSLGCRFALDDFGAGFSTFQYLKRFPVDYLKLDGSFIVNLRHDAMDQELVRHMVAVGHSLGKKIVAEFVEDAETYRLLAGLGVDYAQGYYLGRPRPALIGEADLPPEVRRQPQPDLDLFEKDDAEPLRLVSRRDAG